MIIRVCYANPSDETILYESKEEAMQNEYISEKEVEKLYVLCYTDGDYMADAKTPEEIVKRYIFARNVHPDSEEKKLILDENALKSEELLTELKKNNLY